jgi:hypothetical protein
VRAPALLDACILDVAALGKEAVNVYRTLPTNVIWGKITGTPAVDRDVVAEAPRTVGCADEIDLRQRGRPVLLRLPESADGGNP